MVGILHVQPLGSACCARSSSSRSGTGFLYPCRLLVLLSPGSPPNGLIPPPTLYRLRSQTATLGASSKSLEVRGFLIESPSCGVMLWYIYCFYLNAVILSPCPRGFTTPSRPPDAALDNGVQPLESFKDTSTRPISSNNLTTTSWPSDAAHNNGVQPYESFESTSTCPVAISSFTTPSWPPDALVDCPRLRDLRQELRRKIGGAFNNISSMLGGVKQGKEGRIQDAEQDSSTLGAVLDFAEASQLFRSRAPRGPQNETPGT